MSLEVEKAAGEGERDRHREGAADQRTEAAEEEGVAADVSLEGEAAIGDSLDDADDGADGSCDKRCGCSVQFRTSSGRRDPNSDRFVLWRTCVTCLS